MKLFRNVKSVIFLAVLFSALTGAAQENPVRIQNSHGFEIAPGWWGWYGGSDNIAKEMEKAVDAVLADKSLNYGFEYDGVSWQYLDKYYPKVIQKVRQAIHNGNWEIIGGTFAQQLSYMVNAESNIRQMLYGTKALFESTGQNTKSYGYQEFTMYPQLPYVLRGVGIEHTPFENHMAICGRLKSNFRGLGVWQSNDGTKINSISHDPGLIVGYKDMLHLDPTPWTFAKYINTLDFSKAQLFNPTEQDFYFDAGGYTASYGNLASIYNTLTENDLLIAERFSTLSYIHGGNDFSSQIESAWKALLASQNHDIMYCGSEVYGVEVGCSDYEGGRYLRNAGQSMANEMLRASLSHLSSKANTAFNDKGVALVVFNPLASVQSNVIEKEMEFVKGETFNLQVEFDESIVPYQLSAVEKYEDGSLRKAGLIIWGQDLPALGYRVYQVIYTDKTQMQDYSCKIEKSNIDSEIENRFFRLILHNNGKAIGLYDKQQKKLILGSDQSVEPHTRYDRTPAYRFRNTFGVYGKYQPRGWEVTEQGAVRTVICSRWESENANIRLYQTLYEYLDRIDLTIEYISKNENGDLMEMSPGERKETLWFDFLPTYEGKTRCNTISDFNETNRSYYYSNSWIDHIGDDKSVLLMHKGIHSWSTGYTSQVPRDKREWTVSAELAITLNEWVPGMLRFNQKFSNDKSLYHQFSIVSGAGKSLYKNEREVAKYHLPIPAVEEKKHKGDAIEKSFFSLSGDILLSAMTSDMSSGKEPVIRLWNPNKQKTSSTLSCDFELEGIEEVRIDGISLGESQQPSSDLDVMPVSLKTFKLITDGTMNASNHWELVSSSIPYTKSGNSYTFDAPVEAFRYNHHYGKFSDKKGTDYMITDPFDEIEFSCSEMKEEESYKYWEGKVYVPESYKGNPVRLISKWYSARRYGFATCILTDDYSKRADEPVTLFVNGKEVYTYDGDVSDYIEFGTENTILLKVLYEEIFQGVSNGESDIKENADPRFRPEKARLEELNKDLLKARPSVSEYSLVMWGGIFDKLVSTKLRIGKIITPKNVSSLSDCRMKNSDFSEKLNSWGIEGNVSNMQEGINNVVHINGGGSITQLINIQPGNYYFNVDTKIYRGEYTLSVSGNGLETYEATISENTKWQTNRLKFVVPEGVSQLNLKISSSDGDVLIDDVNIVANKVAKHF